MSDTIETGTALAFLPEDFAEVLRLIYGNDHLSVVTSNNINVIIAALRLAPVGLAAVAYVEVGEWPSDLTASRRAWERVDAAVREWRVEQ